MNVNNLGKHVGHNVEIVEKGGKVDLRCNDCKEVVVRVDVSYKGMDVEEEAAIRIIQQACNMLEYKFTNKQDYNRVVEDVRIRIKEGKEYTSYVYDVVKYRKMLKTVERHYFAIAMSRVFNLPIVMLKQYEMRGYDEIYVEIGARMYDGITERTDKDFSNYVMVERGKHNKIIKILRDQQILVSDNILNQVEKFIKANVQVQMYDKGQVEKLEKHISGAKGKSDMFLYKSGVKANVGGQMGIELQGWI